MPTLLDVQQAMLGFLIAGEDTAIAQCLATPAAADRLHIYRNTFIVSLTKALTLCYPVVKRLVGAEFFEGTAQLFVAQHPPRAAYLDHYGGDFPEFLRGFPAASSLPYLADVAALEWAVNGALHAADAEPLDLQRLASIPPDAQTQLRFVGHPSVRLLRLDYPVDAIWRAILSDDDRALRAIDLGTGAVHVLVERGEHGVDVVRLGPAEWRFAERLFAGIALESALEPASGFDASAALGEHLSSGRFVSFELASVPKIS